MAEHDRRRGGHVVAVVAERPGGHLGGRVEPEHPPGEPAAVAEVACDQEQARDDDKQESGHGRGIPEASAA